MPNPSTDAALAALSARVEAVEARLKDAEMKLAGVIASGQHCAPAGGGVPPLHLIGFKNGVYESGGEAVAQSALVGSNLSYAFDSDQIQAGIGFVQHSTEHKFFALVGAAAAELAAGAAAVFRFADFVTGTSGSFDIFDDPDFTADWGFTFNAANTLSLYSNNDDASIYMPTGDAVVAVRFAADGLAVRINGGTETIIANSGGAPDAAGWGWVGAALGGAAALESIEIWPVDTDLAEISAA